MSSYDTVPRDLERVCGEFDIAIVLLLEINRVIGQYRPRI